MTTLNKLIEKLQKLADDGKGEWEVCEAYDGCDISDLSPLQKITVIATKADDLHDYQFGTFLVNPIVWAEPMSGACRALLYTVRSSYDNT